MRPTRAPAPWSIVLAGLAATAALTALACGPGPRAEGPPPEYEPPRSFEPYAASSATPSPAPAVTAAPSAMPAPKR